MTDVLALYGSPRRGGNSEVLLDAVLKGVEAAGGKVERVRLAELAINPCLNCGACELTGECVIDDDMTGLYDRIVEAQRIVLASPIFFYGITAQAKAFVDRNQALWSRKRLAREAGRAIAGPGRQGYLVSVAATRGAKVFDCAILTMKYAYDAMDVVYAGELLVRGVDSLGEMVKHPGKLAEAEQFGRAIMAGA